MSFFNQIPTMNRDSLRELKKGIDLSFKDFSRAYGDAIEGFFDPLLTFLIWLEKLLVITPWPIVIGVFGLLAWIGSRSIKLVVGTITCFIVIGYFGMWENCMATVAIISVATLVCIVVGIPIGVLMSKSSRVEKSILPILDMMQTIPSFVYLIPIIMLLGIGKVPGLIAVCIYALPPVVRLTNLGIREVDKETLEACEAFGATPLQKLISVQIPFVSSNNICWCKPNDYDGFSYGSYCINDRCKRTWGSYITSNIEPIFSARFNEWFGNCSSCNYL